MTVVPENPVAARVYDEIQPVTLGDSLRGYPLLRFVEAWTKPLMPVENIVRDDGPITGYGKVMHPDTAPDDWLDWLARLTGTKLQPSDTPAMKRVRIKSMQGLRRGSIAAIVSAGQHYLTGNKTVIVNERLNGSAWRLGIRTFEQETPDPAAAKKGFLEQKPVGIVLDYNTVPGHTYDLLRIQYDSYQEIKDNYATYGALRYNLPN